eukprot:TRINITY_DN7098_c0_g3_i1.p1 TRINITY_DN7098_c0_g3~~TRINITY_DN7098_c0_g3_i1.p1  ORF type:complete len:129 (+),score=26.76 TRINITY_DN7098_c0_g3_i1:104-490(+)
MDVCVNLILKREKELEDQFDKLSSELSNMRVTKEEVKLKEQSMNCASSNKALISKVLDLPMSLNNKQNDENENILTMGKKIALRKGNSKKKASMPIKLFLLQSQIDKFTKEGKSVSYTHLTLPTNREV